MIEAMIIIILLVVFARVWIVLAIFSFYASIALGLVAAIGWALYEVFIWIA
jgi:hypothetical protein